MQNFGIDEASYIIYIDSNYMEEALHLIRLR